MRIVVEDPGQDPPGTLHEIETDWTENTTWNTFGATPGYDEDLGAGVAVLPFSLGEHDIDVTNSVQSYLNGAENNGWAFVPDNDSGFDIRSSEFEMIDERPRLSVTICD